MSTGTRRLNFTKRQRIRREHVTVTIHRPRESDPPFVSATLDLSSYVLPPDASIFLEAYRHTAWQRFDFGTAAVMRTPEDRALRDFSSPDGIQFRVKIVSPRSADGPTARILAQADGIKPNEDGPRRSLLPLDPDPSLRDQVWRLEIDENDGPLVRVSTHLVSDRHSLARSPMFVTLALPEIFRRVLTWSLEEVPEDDDWDTPRGRWLRLGLSLLGQDELPEQIDDPHEGSHARDQWVDEAVSSFCREHRIDRVFGNWWREDTPRSAAGGA